MSGHFSYINVIYYCIDGMHGVVHMDFDASNNFHRYRMCFYMININLSQEKMKNQVEL